MYTRHLLKLLLSIMICLMPLNVAAQENMQEEAAGASEAKQSSKEKLGEGTETILLQEGGILLPAGTLAIEPSVNYTHFSKNAIAVSGFTLYQAIVVGRIEVSEVKRDILNGTLTLRYGILNRLQLDLKAPYLYRHDREVFPAGTSGQERVRTISDNGLGDIEGQLSFHALRGNGWLPDVILNLKGKSRTGRDPYNLEKETVQVEEQQIERTTELPTGTGHYGVSGGFTLVKASDPAVFFGGAAYYWNFERDVGGDFGEVDPGNSIQYSFGMAVSLSERASLSFSFQDILTAETEQNGISIPESELNSATLIAGASYSLSRHLSLLASVGVGLSEDAPDFEVQLNLPIYLSLF